MDGNMTKNVFFLCQTCKDILAHTLSISMSKFEHGTGVLVSVGSVVSSCWRFGFLSMSLQQWQKLNYDGVTINCDTILGQYWETSACHKNQFKFTKHIIFCYKANM